MPDDFPDMNLPIDHKTPPTTVREVGIHLIYMSKSMAEIKTTLANMSSSFSTKEDLIDAIDDRKRDMSIVSDRVCAVESRLTKIENIFSGIVTKIAVSAIIMLVVMVLAVYGLDKYLKI